MQFLEFCMEYLMSLKFQNNSTIPNETLTNECFSKKKQSFSLTVHQSMLLTTTQWKWLLNRQTCKNVSCVSFFMMKNFIPITLFLLSIIWRFSNSTYAWIFAACIFHVYFDYDFYCVVNQCLDSVILRETQFFFKLSHNHIIPNCVLSL